MRNYFLFFHLFWYFLQTQGRKKSDRNANQIITWCLKRNFANCEINITHNIMQAIFVFFKKLFFFEIKCFLKRWSAKGREIQITSLHSELKMKKSAVRKCCMRQVIKLHIFILLCWRVHQKFFYSKAMYKCINNDNNKNVLSPLWLQFQKMF